MSSKGLTDKQLAFVEHYLQNGRNGVDAARKAGYRGTPTTLGRRAADALQHPEIQQRIREARQELVQAVRIGTEDKRRLLWDVANYAGRTVEDVETSEYTTPDGVRCRDRIITTRVFDGAIAIAAVKELNAMDGDSDSSGGRSGGHMTLEVALRMMRDQEPVSL